MKEMKLLENELITQKHTKVLEEVEYQYNAPHLFTVNRVEDNAELCKVQFQCGPVKEAGINGVNNEDLIAMVIRRLEGFQDSEYKCKENEIAIEKLQESLMWLRKRYTKRINKGIEGTSIIDTGIICSKCNLVMRKIEGVSLMSNPPKTQYKCSKCGDIAYTSINNGLISIGDK